MKVGGHNDGIEETTTFCLIPEVAKAVQIPLIAAGGIIDGRSMLAAMVLGADAVQMGTRFVASEESSAHINFKQKVVGLREGETQLTLKEITQVRLIKNNFYSSKKIYESNGTLEDLKNKLGRGRAKKGMFEGDMVHGELEIGQAASQINTILPANVILRSNIRRFQFANNDIYAF